MKKLDKLKIIEINKNMRLLSLASKLSIFSPQGCLVPLTNAVNCWGSSSAWIKKLHCSSLCMIVGGKEVVISILEIFLENITSEFEKFQEFPSWDLICCRKPCSTSRRAPLMPRTKVSGVESPWHFTTTPLTPHKIAPGYSA